MKHTKKRIMKLIDELTSYFFMIGATDFTCGYHEEKDAYRIEFCANYEEKYREKVLDLEKYLSLEKQEEVEEYYWELAGDCDVDSELILLGIMSDEAELDIGEHDVRIVIRRYKG